MSKILCSIATYKRYDTTLPLVLNAIINQTKLPDKLIIYDDNDDPQDLRNNWLYSHFFSMAKQKELDWEVVFAQKKGQHHIHQDANRMGYEWVWRVDDDAIPEPDVLENLYMHTRDMPNLGAIGGSILNPQDVINTKLSTGKIENIDKEANIQWGYITQAKTVEHLHCSFLYKAGVYDYNLGLSRVAHREETLFTYGLHQKGFTLLVVPNAVTWHLRNPEGGIRSHNKQQLFDHDEEIYKNFMKYKDHTIVVLNSGMGDHIVAKKIINQIHNPLIFTCYPEIIDGQSIAKAIELFGDIDQWNIYKKMDQWKWKKSLEEAYRKLYL